MRLYADPNDYRASPFSCGAVELRSVKLGRDFGQIFEILEGITVGAPSKKLAAR